MANTIIKRSYYNTQLAMMTDEDGTVGFFELVWVYGSKVWRPLPASAGIVRVTFYDLLPPTAMDFWMYDQEYDWEEKTSEPRLYLKSECDVLEARMWYWIHALDHAEYDFQTELYQKRLDAVKWSLFMLGG